MLAILDTERGNLFARPSHLLTDETVTYIVFYKRNLAIFFVFDMH